MCVYFVDEWDPRPTLDATPEGARAFWKQDLPLLVGNPTSQEGKSAVRLFPLLCWSNNMNEGPKYRFL